MRVTRVGEDRILLHTHGSTIGLSQASAWELVVALHSVASGDADHYPPTAPREAGVRLEIPAIPTPEDL